jgi:hypothetical protein
LPDKRATTIKSLFASFSSEKEGSSFFVKKEAKKLLSAAAQRSVFMMPCK